MSAAMSAQCGVLPLDPIAKSVLLVLADGADQYGIARLPALDFISVRVGWPIYLVIAAIQEIESLGALEALSKDRDEYRILPAALKVDRVAWPGALMPVRK